MAALFRPAIRTIALTTADAVFIFLFSYIYSAFISDLPRPMQGESVTTPWPVCLFVYLAILVLLPWWTSRVIIRNMKQRLVLLAVHCALLLLWFCALDGIGLLSKAWKRGL